MADIWTDWLLHRRFGGDRELMERELTDFLYPVRDKVLDNAALEEGETLLDVGCGDGLIAFGALERTETSQIIFSDISADLLALVAKLVQEMEEEDRCRFVRAAAGELSPIAGASVDAVTTRSVLIYEPRKEAAFREFYRVLRPGGRISLFEPINSFGKPAPPHLFMGFDVTPVQELAARLKALYDELQPPGRDPMVDFDERDLLRLAETAGFRTIKLDYRATIRPYFPVQWEHLLSVAGNPKIPSLGEAMEQLFSAAERERFVAHLRPLVEAQAGTLRRAHAYLTATK